ncbi:unnamed protein product [Blepharisma stoltei]|uniref:Uncharacterized protein n=1 Tax=Blepharisma stoltei TaxID=1481888 RepID=A0AAU9J6M0_9CILI|nr:unnamed protein product [Blepharisma stoltei]
MMELQDLSTKSENSSSSSLPYFSLSTNEKSVISKIFFLWIKPILALGSKSVINIEDTLPLPDEESAIKENLTKTLEKYKLSKAIFIAHKGLIFKTILLYLSITSFEFGYPIFIKLFISYIESGAESLLYGVLLSLCFTTIVLLTQILIGQFHWHCKLLELRVKNAISSVVYNKILKVSSISEGLGINLLQVDIRKIYDCIPKISIILLCPLNATYAIILVSNQVGDAVYAAIVTLFLCISLNYIVALKIKKYSENLMTIRDKRIEASTQMLSNIKMIKAYCWENYFKGAIKKIRNSELSFLRFLNILSSTVDFFYFSIPSLTSGSVFLYYTFIMGKTITAGEAFVTLITLNILQDSLQWLPYFVSDLLICFVSIKRMQTFLDEPDIKELAYSDSATLNNCSFSIGDTKILKNISLQINKKEFIAITGPVGCGKSALLNSLMNEMSLSSGSATTFKSLAFVSSLDSWLQNESIRNNILFGLPYKEEWYKIVIEACALVQDINSLPDKDLTEIGGKGINLSGGQKARICLARAVYADKDVYLLDDPLSSVDTDVASHIIDECLLGILSKKTKVLATHRLDILNKVDRVVILENGTIKEITTPEKLIITDYVAQNYESKLEDIANAQNKLVAEEEREMGRVNLAVYNDYLKYSGGYSMLGLASVCIVLWASTRVLGDVMLKEWAMHPDDIDHTYLFLFLGLRFGGSLFIYIRTLFLLVIQGIRASKNIHKAIINSFSRAPVNLFYDVTPLGRILNRISKDLNTIDESISRLICTVATETCLQLSKVILTLIYFPMTILIIPPLLYFANQIKNKFLNVATDLVRLEATSISPVLNHFKETSSGVKIIRTFNRKQNFQQKNYQLLDNSTRVQYSLGACRCWLQTNLGFLSAFITCTVTLLIIIFRTNISPGIVGLVLTYALSLPGGVTYLVQVLADTENNSISVERATEYMNLPKENAYIKPIDEKIKEWPVRPTIEFRDVQMKYRQNTPIVLKKTSFCIDAGHRIGLVGRTGSGKSSIFLCLLRLVELTSGSILIDGVNIAQIGLKKLRSALTLVPQDPLVFSGTLQSNLDPTGAKSEIEIYRALEEVGLSRFPIDFEVKQDGTNLSSGERQLISLGRAMLSHNKIILFDEATAGIDNESDAKIQDLIKNKFVGCTILTIAHRIGTIMNNNLIIVMNDGKVQEIDSPQNLLLTNSLFKNIRDAIK